MSRTLLTVTTIARDLGCNPKSARQKLRRHNLSGAKVIKGSKRYHAIRACLTGSKKEA